MTHHQQQQQHDDNVRNNARRRPLMVLPVLKETGAGWSNLEFPSVLKKNATGTRSLVICAGLHKGLEFFEALENGFEVVGFEPDPKSFAKIARICETKYVKRCQALSKDFKEFPLQRRPGISYLFPFALGEKKDVLPFYSQGELSTFVSKPTNTSGEPLYIPVESVDTIIQEDVYFFMMDVQGFEYNVLQGATRLFQNYNVRQILLEVDPVLLNRQSVTLPQIIEKLQQFGLMCMTAQENNGCPLWSDTAERIQEEHWSRYNGMRMAYSPCFDDLLCVNIEKAYLGPTLPLLLPLKSSETNMSHLAWSELLARAHGIKEMM